MASAGLTNSFKVELLQAGHNFCAAQSGVSCSGTGGSNSLTGLASTSGLAVGMSVTGSGIAANTTIVAIPSATTLTIYPAASGSVTSVSFAGDVIKMALIKASPSRTFGPDQTNIGTPGSGASSTASLGTDEIAPSGTYASGGVTLTEVQPILSGTAAVLSFGNVTITGATISTTGALIYNASSRLGTAGRVISVLDFGGTVSCTSGTLNLTMPTDAAGTALIQIS